MEVAVQHGAYAERTEDYCQWDGDAPDGTEILYDPVKQKVFFSWHVSFNEKCDLRKRLVPCLRLKLNLLLTHNLQFHLLQSNSFFDVQGERNIP